MYKYLVAFVLLSPMLGIWLVEGGEFSASTGTEGYENGATLAYGAYAAIVALVAWISSGSGRRRRRGRGRFHKALPADAEFRTFAYSLLVLSTVFLLVFLVGFGAIGVWTGSIGKGEFRTSLGPLALLPNLMTKFILPALLAYGAALYLRTSKSRRMQRWLAANMLVIFFVGASWGFKSTAFFVLLPALLIFYWDVRVWTLLKLALAFVATIVAFYFLFDAGVEEYSDVQTFLFRRITVLQGDVSWFIWGEYQSGADFPNYWLTLWAAVGDTVLTLVGLERADFYNWMLYHYDFMLTYLVGVPLDRVEEGHSVTGTPFSEGLVAGGMAGVLFFALVAGLLVGRLHAFLQRSLGRGNDTGAAVAATYFCFNVFTWLNGGAIVQLFHVSVLISLGVTYLALAAMRRTVSRPAAQVVPA